MNTIQLTQIMGCFGRSTDLLIEDLEYDFRLAQLFDLIPILVGAESFLTPKTRPSLEYDTIRSSQ